jgi:pyruvate/2-oxoglutarate dehydrogenase complex dihydrolipoamide dehydrogenase (E3) component
LPQLVPRLQAGTEDTISLWALQACHSGQTNGLLKAIVDTGTGRILECSLLCHAAGEMISTVQMVRQAQIPYTILRDGVLTHPTMTEGLNLLFSKL